MPMHQQECKKVSKLGGSFSKGYNGNQLILYNADQERDRVWEAF